MQNETPIGQLAVNPDKASDISSIPRTAIYAAIANGDLPSFKAGKRRLILVKDIDAWLTKMAKEEAK
ncbi:DNA-binding protein [Pseudomonas sp. T]|nr:DNA-binding protein [Pseudomonas sp. T]